MAIISVLLAITELLVDLKYLKIIQWTFLWLNNLCVTYNSLSKEYEQIKLYAEQIILYVV